MQNRFQNAFMIANPHYYDYIHTLEFSNGTVELVDGAGQVLNAVVGGRYRVFGEDETSARIDFFSLVETNPYSRKHEKIRDIAPIQVKVVREEGLFPFPKNVMLKIEKKGRHPCLLYRERYIFDTDPLSFFAKKRQAQNLYYLTEKMELTESARYYYLPNDGQSLTMKEIVSLGISEEELWKLWQSNTPPEITT